MLLSWQLPLTLALAQQHRQLGSEKKEEREHLVCAGFFPFLNCWGQLAEVTVWEDSVGGCVGMYNLLESAACLSMCCFCFLLLSEW